MIEITLLLPDDAAYDLTMQFVRQMYLTDLNADIEHQPAYFFAAFKGDEVVGCLGLDNDVVSPIFASDLRFQRLQQSWGVGVRAVNQSFFAVKGHSIAVPALIAVVAAYAEAVGINKIAYAGIDVSCRTIERLGLSVAVLGQTNLELLNTDLQRTLATWQQRHNPITCVLDTAGAREIALAVLDRHKCRVRLNPELDCLIFPSIQSYG